MSAATRSPAAAAAVAVEALSFGYPHDGARLDGVSLTVAEGEVCCLLGPNGAGKTTLLRCLLGLLRPDSGTIRVAGQEIGGMSARKLARHVAYVPQSSTSVFPFTTLEIAVMGRTPHLGLAATPSAADRRLAQATLDELGIGHLAAMPFSFLSGGERQLALLGRALVQEAPVLVLDEPTAALDYGNEVRILQTVAELAGTGRSILMTTHQPNHALSYAGHAILMRRGAIVADGSPQTVVTGEQLSALYGVPVQVLRADVAGPHGSESRTFVVATPPERRSEGNATGA